MGVCHGVFRDSATRRSIEIDEFLKREASELGESMEFEVVVVGQKWSGKSTIMRHLKSIAIKPGDIDECNPRGIDNDKPESFDDGKPGGTDDGKLRGIDNGKPEGIDNTKPEGTDDGKQQGIDNTEPGDIGNTKPGGIDDGKPEGIDDGKPRGTDDSKPGGTDDSKPGGTDDGKPRGTDDRKPGGTDDSKPGGTDDSKPRGTDDSKPRGTDDSKPGGADDSKPGCIDDGCRPNSIPVVHYSSRPNVNMKIIDLDSNILRNKTIRRSFFEDVAAVIYITAISNYDQTDAENADQNQLQESVNFFNTLCNLWFRHSTIFLVLNKKDLFAEKIKTTPLRTCFPEYTGSGDYNEAAAFVLSKFEAVDNMKDTRDIHSHLFSGANPGNVQFLFDVVADVLGRPRCNCHMLLF